MSVTIIGEPGCTAEGDYDQMLALIDVAIAAGVDAVKMQWTSNPARMIERRTAHWAAGAERDEARARYGRYYGWLAFPVTWHRRFAARCYAARIQYACTAYLPEDVATLAPFVDAIKVASFESGDLALIDAAIETKRPVWVSVGMCQRDDLETLNERAARLPRLTLFQCTSAYPCPIERLHLGVLLDEPFVQGFSDHSPPEETWTGAVAVAAGATHIEAHYRLLSADPENPDVPHAMTPDQLAAYVTLIRKAEAALGHGRKGLMDVEASMARYRVHHEETR